MIARFWLKRYNVDVSREFAGIIFQNLKKVNNQGEIYEYIKC